MKSALVPTPPMVNANGRSHTDGSGFNVLMTGINGQFINAYFMTSSGNNGDSILNFWGRVLNSTNTGVIRSPMNTGHKTSLRCLKGG